MSDPNARYIVGIDLGTTHTVMAYADISDGPHHAVAQVFEIEQLVGAGEVAKKKLLPSFRYHPAAAELADQDLLLPWQGPAMDGELKRVVIGEWARQLGAKVEGRLVVSAKSWLSHTQVDRAAAILPWAGVDDVEKVSPVLASASYLQHLRQAWNHEHPDQPLEHQEVVITVPASFDEMARSLTVEAASIAGLSRVLLLEEPQAVCYDWYAQHQADASQLLQDIQLLLVCDIGGGTTDLSLVAVSSHNGELELKRLGVGNHLMLGGDNVDLALAHRAEQRIVGDGKKLRAASLAQLIQQTRVAKELLLSDQAPDKATVTVLAGGAKLLGGAKSCELSQQEVKQLALDGFFPVVTLDQMPGKRQTAVVEFGLPYVADPAVSKHIAEFIARHQGVCRQALGLEHNDARPAVPDAVLFNGGVFKSPVVSRRALAVISGWAQQDVAQLDNQHPDLAVAYGAVAYGLARRGAFIKIGGGSARSYFLRIDNKAEGKQAVCLLAKGSNEGVEQILQERRFALKLGQPVQFHLVSSTLDHEYGVGEITDVDGDEFVFLPPLVVALENEAGDSDEVTVQLLTTLTEVGTIQLQCASVANPAQRWNVEFQIRKELAQQKHGEQQVTQLHPQFEQAREKILGVFGQSKKDADPKAVTRLRHDLEKILGKRESWEPATLRAMFDLIVTTRKRRRRSTAHERGWFNLAGYCLRPGFGYELDDWRIQQIWPLYQQGLQFSADRQCWSEWWIFWRRAAGGLDPQQQARIYKDIAKYIKPSALRNRKLLADLNKNSYEDMVRLIAALEHLPTENKVDVGQWFLQRLQKPSETQTSWWALGRVGSRVPFHGSAHNVVASETVEQWLQPLLEQDWKKNDSAAFCAVMLSRKCGDRSRDIDDDHRLAVVEKLGASRAPASWVAMVSETTELDAAETKRVFGEALPPGLTVIDL
jgi:molecular chaperone DnaK (HSP70)